MRSYKGWLAIAVKCPMSQKINQVFKMIASIILQNLSGLSGEAPKPKLQEGKCSFLINNKFRVKWVKPIKCKKILQWILASYHLVFLLVQTTLQKIQASKWKRPIEVILWTDHFKSKKMSHRSQVQQQRKEDLVLNQIILLAQLKLTLKIMFPFTSSSIKMDRG